MVLRCMSNAERSQNKRLSREICDILNENDVDDNIKVGAVLNAMSRLELKKLKLQQRIKQSNRSNCGRKMTALVTRLKVWQHWHEVVNTVSTITDRPAKLRTDQDLPYVYPLLKMIYSHYTFSSSALCSRSWAQQKMMERKNLP